jgi:DNA-directed RNA polymerase specialized sigma24 family protein
VIARKQRVMRQDRLLTALSAHLAALYRVVDRVADAGTDADEVIEHLARLAASGVIAVRKGQERAWLLTMLLRLIGAREAPAEQVRLPRLPGPVTPRRSMDVPPASLERLADALQEMEKLERASVVLVVQEGLSLEQAAMLLGGTRQAFAQAYAEGLESLDDELLDVLMSP